jgi:hypothetical protein
LPHPFSGEVSSNLKAIGLVDKHIVSQGLATTEANSQAVHMSDGKVPKDEDL